MNLQRKHNIRILLMSALLLWLLGLGLFHSMNGTPISWTEEEKDILASLWLENLEELPPDPSNSVADIPLAAELGHRLFFDPRLSGNGEVSCATCHQPGLRFTDGLQLAKAIGTSKRNTPSIIGTAYSPWFYWDGRKDSQWSQALSPLEDPAEHGGNRMSHVRVLATDPVYRDGYQELFGALPDFSDHDRYPEQAGPVLNQQWREAWEDMRETDRDQVNRVYANMGKMIAAYERKLMPGPARFDTYVEAVTTGDQNQEIMNSAEISGLRLFIGEARCMECHNGPLFTNNEFHNTGLLPLPGQVPDRGRSSILLAVKSDSFNCLGPYSDAENEQCDELIYMRTAQQELIGAMRTPSLRNLQKTAPYMHKGQMATLTEVLRHYNEAPLALIGHNESEPLGLSGRQLDQLAAFLDILASPPNIDPHWLMPPASLP